MDIPKKLLTKQPFFKSAISLILSLSFLMLDNNNLINILFWDRWDFLTNNFNENDNLLSIFPRQNMPHRQGLIN
jgi:hypothetical protein